MIFLAIVLSLCVQAGLWNTNKKDVVLDGYDLVSYFEGAPTKGVATINYRYEGVLFYFSSESNKSKFIENPSAYLPKYGGWCAYAMGDSGDKVPVNPITYKIIDHQLFLFYNARGNNTLIPWNKNETRLKSQADKNWELLIKD